MKRLGGFSLVEVVLVLFLSGIILLVVSRLTQQAFEASRVLDEKARTIQSARMGLEALGAELREAVEVKLGPNDGEPIVFKKVVPAAPAALGIVLTDKDDKQLEEEISSHSVPLVSGYEDEYLGSVEYSLDDEQLARKATYKSSSLVIPVASGVNSFIVKAAPKIDSHDTPANAYQITLSIREKRLIKTFTTIVLVPGLK